MTLTSASTQGMIDKAEEMLVTPSVNVDTETAHGTRDCTRHERLHTAHGDCARHSEAAHRRHRSLLSGVRSRDDVFRVKGLPSVCVCRQGVKRLPKETGHEGEEIEQRVAS